MAVTLNNYKPQMWAQEALMYLRQKTGFSSRVHRGYEGERSGFQNRGDVINFRRPQELNVQDIYSSAPVAEDIDTPNLSLTLDKHQAVHFQVSDKDLAFAGERLISEHVAPAMDALGTKVDSDIAAAMAAASPFVVDHNDYATPAEVLATVRQQFAENKAPMDQLTYAVSPSAMTKLIADQRFAAWEGAAGTGVATQTSGILGRKYGFEWLESLSLPSTTIAAITPGADLIGATTAAFGAGATSITVDSFGTSAADLSGQVISAGGEFYLVQSGTLSSGAGTLVLATSLRKPLVDGAVVLMVADLHGGVATQVEDIAFSPKSTALVVAPLPMHAANMGANIFTAQDPESGLSVRARLNYDNPNGNVNVIFDVLYGVKVLDERQIVRVVNAG